MSYEPVQARVKPGLFAKAGSANANRIKIKQKPKAVPADSSYSMSLLTGEFRERSSAMSFDILKQVSKQVAPISAILFTRIDQIGAFTSQSRYTDGNMGFRVKLKDQGSDPTPEQEAKAKQIENFIMNCGFGKDQKRDSFDVFIRKIIRDSLTYDQVNFELVRDLDGKIAEFHAVDASTIRAATEDYTPGEDLNAVKEDEEVAYVQVINNSVVAWFTEEEMAFGTRNPSTDITAQPYGISEIETIVKQLTSYLEAEQYNMRFFQQGGMSKGILNIKQETQGIGSQQALESFKRQWRNQVTGQRGAWRIPIMEVPGTLEFIDIAQSGGEMVFEHWINYLINICCAIYRIDPAEINFPNNGGISGTGKSLFDNSNRDKYEHSKHKGLVPILQFLKNLINEYIISEFGEEFIFVFEGIDGNTEQEQANLDEQESKTIKTVNEIRAKRGLQPIPNGDIIRDPIFMQAMVQASITGSGNKEGENPGSELAENLFGDEPEDTTPFEVEGELEGGREEEEDNSIRVHKSEIIIELEEY